MRSIAFSLLIACSLFAAGCSRKSPAPAVEATAAPRESAEAEKQKEAAEETAQAKKNAEAAGVRPAEALPNAVFNAPSPTATPTP
jgi:PBP1b-binding outer membrane lipoprotein LpoB